MITQNYENFLACLITSEAKGLLPATRTNGDDVYVAGYVYSTFGQSTTTNFVTTSGAGIWVGSGNTPATKGDYALENRITSGLSKVGNTTVNVDEDNGNPYIRMDFILENTSGADITIKEVGYVQTLRYSASKSGAASTSSTFLIDRTVLESPVTIPAGGTGTIRYILKTVVSGS